MRPDVLSAVCAGRRWPRYARRSSRPSGRRSVVFSRAGTGSTVARCVRRSCRSRARAPREALGVRGAAAWRVPNSQRLPARPTLCVGRARLGRRRSRPRRALLPRGRGPSRPRRAAPPRPRPAQKIRDALAGGAKFWFDLVQATGLAQPRHCPRSWDLVWSGEVRDAWTPLRAVKRYEAPAAASSCASFLATAREREHGGAGSLVAHRRPLPGRARPSGARGVAPRAQGIVTRRRRARRGIPGGYGAVYGELRALETLGVCRRGYFVEASAARSFARGAVWSACVGFARATAASPKRWLLAAADPAQPYGARSCGRSVPAVAPRASRGRLHRSAGRAGALRRAWGRVARCAPRAEDDWLREALAALVDHVGVAAASASRSGASMESQWARREITPLLLEAGLLPGPRRAVLRP